MQVLTTLPSNNTTNTQCRPLARSRKTLFAALRSLGLEEDVESTRRFKSSEPIKAKVKLYIPLISNSLRLWQCSDSPREYSPGQHKDNTQAELPPKLGTPGRVFRLDWRGRFADGRPLLSCSWYKMYEFRDREEGGD